MLPILSALFVLIACGCQLDLSLCPEPGPDTVVLYLFDEGIGDEILNRSGTSAPNARIMSSSVKRTDGPCGGALFVPQTPPFGQGGSGEVGYAMAPSDPSFKLRQGSIELWVRFEPLSAPGVQGILSRDAVEEDTPGHFVLARIQRESGENSLGLRIQNGDASVTDDPSFCSTPTIPSEVWHAIRVDFGGGRPVEISVNGVPLQNDASIQDRVAPFLSCGFNPTVGIEGNDEPWVIGAVDVGSTKNSATPVHAGLGGSIASLHIRSTRGDR